MTETKTCQNCSKDFSIKDSNKAFYKRMKVPYPVDCPDCREQRRLTFRNEKTLYVSKCDGCQQKMVSVYSPDKPYHVYCNKCFWSDKWDPVDQGRDFDFSQPFFVQFDELIQDAKLINLVATNNQNADYVNQETDDKNCYMNAGGHYNEDCYYNTYSLYGKNNVDNYWVFRSELCYECIHCERCFNCSFLEECQSCSDCHFCKECIACNNCFGCFGLKHKEYYFFNEKLDKESYEERVANYPMENALKESTEHFLKFPHRAHKLVQCENCSGNDLLNCKNCHNCFQFENSEDCEYLYIGVDLKDCQDIASVGWGEMVYNSASSMQHNNIICCSGTININFSQYCFACNNSSNLFGCVGLNHKNYCILNKQYSREQYEKLLPRIIEYMKSTGEYGQFFPPEISPFCYNETVANEYFPLTKEQALQKGYKWKDPEEKEHYEPTDQIKVCADCGNNYKIIAEENRFYERQKLSIPIKFPTCRQKRRMIRLLPRQLYDRHCQKCQKEIKTPYSEKRPEIIYCEECYLEAI